MNTPYGSNDAADSRHLGIFIREGGGENCKINVFFDA